MKLTTLEILEVSRGLPALVQHFLQKKELQRAYDLGIIIQKLKTHVELFELHRQALQNAYGIMGKRERHKELLAGTDEFVLYETALREILSVEVEVDVEPVYVTADDVEKLDPLAFVAIVPILKVLK